MSTSSCASMEQYPRASSVVIACLYSDYIPAVGHCSIFQIEIHAKKCGFDMHLIVHACESH